MEKIQKNDSISLLRMIAFLSVIFCHIFEQSAPILGEKEWILRSVGNYCAVGVQIFLLISGYLYGSRKNLFNSSNDRIVFVIKNFYKVLKHYWIYCLFVIIPVYKILNPEIVTLTSILRLLTASEAWWGIHHLWFIPYILLCYLLLPYLYDFKQWLLTPPPLPLPPLPV